MIVKIGLFLIALVIFVRKFIKQVNRIRETKARVKLAQAKWLLERVDECDLKAEDDTKTWPPEKMT